MQHDNEDRQEPEQSRGIGRVREGQGDGQARGERRRQAHFESEEHEPRGRWDGRAGQRDMDQRAPQGEYGGDEPGSHRGPGYTGGGGPGTGPEDREYEFHGLGAHWHDHPHWHWHQHGHHHYWNIFDHEERSRRDMDRGASSFRGTGPKGYSRSDDRILEDVSEHLLDADVDASDVTVKVEDGEVTLSGTIESRWAKRYVEDLAYLARGVRDVRNLLRVAKSKHREKHREDSASQQSGAS